MTKQAKKNLTLAAAIAGVLVVAAVVWTLFAFANGTDAASSATNGSLDWFTVEPTSFDVTIIASGELEARNQIEVKSKVSGSAVITSVIEEGKPVKEGDTLAKLDDKQITEQIETETLNVEQARAEMIASQRDLELAEQEAANDTKAAEVRLLLAELEMQKWLEGDVKQKRRDLDLALLKAERQLERAQRDLELSTQLREQNFISQNELEDSELAEIEAREALTSAKLDIEIYNQYVYEKEEKQNTSDVDQARVNLERTKRQNEIKLARHQADVESKTKTLELRSERLDEYHQQLEYTTIKAPSDGIVVYATSVGRRRNNNDPIAPGRQIRYDETIFLLPDTSQMVATVRVHEALVPQVRIDQRVTVNIDARASRPVEGKVTSVGVMAEDGGWINPQLREYLVKVALPTGFDDSLKPAMRCSGQIHVGRVENSLAVPVQAVFTEGRLRFCHVAAGDSRVRRQPVTIGRSSETLVEIAKGLEAGQRVLLRSPRPGEVIEEQKDTPAGDA